MTTTTKQQLIGYGLSEYQATTITKGLIPVGSERRKKVYSLSDAIAAILERLENRRIKAQTRQSLEVVLNALRQRLNNVVPASFVKGTDPVLSKLAKQALDASLAVDNHINDLKATAATIAGKQKKNGLRRKAVS